MINLDKDLTEETVECIMSVPDAFYNEITEDERKELKYYITIYSMCEKFYLRTEERNGFDVYVLSNDFFDAKIFDYDTTRNIVRNLVKMDKVCKYHVNQGYNSGNVCVYAAPPCVVFFEADGKKWK